MTLEAHPLEARSTGAHPLEAQLLEAIARLQPTTGQPAETLTADIWWELFDAMATSRCLDLAARRWRERGHGYYTIGSAGHESNAAVAHTLRPTDPALLHYRSGAFYVTRARQVPGIPDPIEDVLLGMMAAADEPIAGGRHKVFGHPRLAVIPQTSTIASHLPRAVGVAFAIERARRIGEHTRWPDDAIAVCSFGDASVNHSTLQGALNTASHIATQRLPLPLLLVCEDNGLGISVRTPENWVENSLAHRAGIDYLAADGCDIADTFATAKEAVTIVREQRRPVVVHVSTVRFLGHAGSDVESGYRTPAEIAADAKRDPLLRAAALAVNAGFTDPAEIVAAYRRIDDEVEKKAAEAVHRRRLATKREVIAPLAPRRPESVAREAAKSATKERRAEIFRGGLPENEGPLTLAAAINRALHDILAVRPNALVFGEDVAVKGGVYGVTRQLHRSFGATRVFDTVLDEQAILGLALGCGVSGLLPIPEVQYLAYVHNAEDQIRGEAATQQFFSKGAFRNPMVIRVAGLAYQKGFGGHFHNDNSVAVFRDVPGLVVAIPATAADAPAMLRTCVAAAHIDGTVSVFVEPIALYHERDLHEPGDNGWLASYAGPDDWPETHVPIGSARTHGDGDDLTIVTFGNGLRMSLRAARRLEREHGLTSRVLDLRWVAPLPVEDILREAAFTGRVLVVDETRRSGGVAEGVIAALADAGFAGRIARVAAADSFVPLGPAADLVLVDEPSIEAAARALVGSVS